MNLLDPFEEKPSTGKVPFAEGNLTGNIAPQIPPYNQATQASQAYGAAPQISTAELQVHFYFKGVFLRFDIFLLII